MNNKEARSILAEFLTPYRSRPYAELASFVRTRHVETSEIIGKSGAEYQIEVQFFWDDKTDADVRVIGSITDGRGFRAFLPLTDTFILNPEGKFVGE